jgi:hypothetical protein
MAVVVVAIGIVGVAGHEIEILVKAKLLKGRTKIES